MEWAHGGGGSPHTRPPYRSQARRPGPPPFGSSFRPYPPFRPQERPFGRPMKWKNQEFRQPLSSGFEHGPPKHFRRELSMRPFPLRGFRGRGMSLQDKSRLIKARRFRAESVARFKLPPPRPRISERVQKPKPQTAPKNAKDSPGVPPRKLSLKKMPSSRESSPNTDAKTAEPERDSKTKGESRRSVSAHRYGITPHTVAMGVWCLEGQASCFSMAQLSSKGCHLIRWDGRGEKKRKSCLFSSWLVTTVWC